MRICIIGSIWRGSVFIQGLPARICWIGLQDRARVAWRLMTWCARRVKRPVVIGQDHLDSGSVASPNRETEAC